MSTLVMPGKALAHLRRAAGVSQAQLAARLGTTQSAVARLEGGRLSPSFRTLESAYAALGHRLELLPMPLGSDYLDLPAQPSLLLAELPRPRYRTRGMAGVDLSQIRAARRLTPARRLDRLAAAARGLADLREAIQQ